MSAADLVSGTKRCSQCARMLTIGNFTKQSKRKDGLNPWCRECHNAAKAEIASRPDQIEKRKAYSKEYDQQPHVYAKKLNYARSQRGKDTKHRSRLKRYGLSSAAFDAMLLRQAGCCAVCGLPFAKQACVDHDHQSGLVRGLLCRQCNLGLGFFADSPHLLDAAAVYLRNFAWRLVVIESPYAGDVERNLRYVRACMSDCVKRGEAPYASHALLTQPGILDDNVPEERALGIRCGFDWASIVGVLRVFYVDLGWSSGMKDALDHAKQIGQPLEERRLGGEWAQ